LTQNKRRYDKSIRPQDDAQYKARTAKLAAQVSIYEVLPGQFVDGQLTLRETVPDLGGIAIAYDAYQNSLREHQKKDDPMIIAVWQRFPQTIF
jgi:predicted metalloendopeptidase